MSRGIEAADFNSYGSRRGNDRVMTRGTFANVRIKNLMVPGHRRRRDEALSATAKQMSILRRGDEVSEGRTAAGHAGGTGIRHRLVARLGGERARVCSA